MCCSSRSGPTSCLPPYGKLAGTRLGLARSSTYTYTVQDPMPQNTYFYPLAPASFPAALTFLLFAMAKSCLRCGPDQHGDPEDEMMFYHGEVFGIRESVFTPIEDILRRISGLTGEALRRSRSSFYSLRSRGSATHKRRPCILMNRMIRKRNIGTVLPHVCLMCTFEKTPIDDLPRIFRHFCLQVFTENAKLLETTHLHSMPVWPMPGEMQWIIMWRFQTTRELLGRWPTKAGCGERTGMAFGKKAMSQLNALCEKKQHEWKAFCETQPGFAEEQERQINVRLEHYST